MATTRRDLLAALVAVPLAVALPETATSNQPSAPLAPVYLNGYTAFQDYTQEPDVRQMLGGDFELYVDERKAIMRTAIKLEDATWGWLERVYVQPEQIAMMRDLCAMLKEATP